METPKPDLIQKLQAMAIHPNTPEHERAAAIAKRDALLKKYNLSAADLSVDALVLPWEMQFREASHCTLAYFCIRETVGKDSSLRYKKIPRQTILTIQVTAVVWADFRGCYGHYIPLFVRDQKSARAAVRKAKAMKAKPKVKKLAIKAARLALQNLVYTFINKYGIGEESVRKEWAEREGTMAGTTPEPATPHKKPTKEEREASLVRDMAWDIASDSLGAGERWQKGEGLEGAEQLKLE
jgi:hypothetical protein